MAYLAPANDYYYYYYYYYVTDPTSNKNQQPDEGNCVVYYVLLSKWHAHANNTNHLNHGPFMQYAIYTCAKFN